MGKKGKRAKSGKLTSREVLKRLDALTEKVQAELEVADLFVPPPPNPDCPLCFLPLPHRDECSRYMPCCGKTICVGCEQENDRVIRVQNAKNKANNKPLIADCCPFCREPEIVIKSEKDAREVTERLEKRMECNDPDAFDTMGGIYESGEHPGTPKNDIKALEMFVRAVELGCSTSCPFIAMFYRDGRVVPKNEAKMKTYMQAAILYGDIKAHHNLGALEFKSDNFEAAVKHWRIAAEGGYELSAKMLKRIYNGKDQYKRDLAKRFESVLSDKDLEQVMQKFQEAQEEFKSEERAKYENEEDVVTTFKRLDV